MLDLHDFQAYTFDCYGTLIDWESGIENCLLPFLAGKGIGAAPDEILSLYATFESEAQKGDYRKYRFILRDVMQAFAAHFEFDLSEGEELILEDSLPGWPCFEDTKAGLQKLSEGVKLGIISNIDEDLIAATVRKIAVNFEWIITAEAVQSYKPDKATFEAAIAKMGLEKGQILHCAQSIYHDILPASELGISTVWVDRRGGAPGGATLEVELASPAYDLRVGSVGEIAFRYAAGPQA